MNATRHLCSRAWRFAWIAPWRLAGFNINNWSYSGAEICDYKYEFLSFLYSVHNWLNWEDVIQLVWCWFTFTQCPTFGENNTRWFKVQLQETWATPPSLKIVNHLQAIWYSASNFWLYLGQLKMAEGNNSQDNNDHLIRSSDNQHPANLIPELCRKFWTLGWVTGTGGGTSIRNE